MIDIKGVKLKRLPVDLHHITDIEYFEGPLLSEFRSSRGDSYLYSWCDCDDEVNRWLVVRVDRLDIWNYDHEDLTLFQILSEARDGFVYICDINKDQEVEQVWMVLNEDIPEECLPVDIYLVEEDD